MSKAHWMALALVPGIGGATARKLFEQFGDIETVFEASAEELIAVPRVTATTVEHLRAASLDQYEAELYALADQDIDMLTWDDPRFPARLRQLSDPPVVLFIRGTLRREDDHAVAIVGTREPTPSGIELATTLARELALRGLTVVSGLALGIDTAAHTGALAAEGGRTLAVLGSGIRVIHPRENAELAGRITAHGAVLSELMPNAPPRGPQLMARDRLISGLSRAVIVVEAGSKSGSLDTADRARKQKRVLYAVPGTPGTDGLLRTGAQPLDPASLDFDALADEIYTFESDNPNAPPSQLDLWPE